MVCRLWKAVSSCIVALNSSEGTHSFHLVFLSITVTRKALTMSRIFPCLTKYQKVVAIDHITFMGVCHFSKTSDWCALQWRLWSLKPLIIVLFGNFLDLWPFLECNQGVRDKPMALNNHQHVRLGVAEKVSSGWWFCNLDRKLASLVKVD